MNQAADPTNDSGRLSPDELVNWPERLAREQSLILRVLADAPSKRVLDLGCGAGRHARLLAEHGYEVTGIDLSETALERARSGPVPAGVEFLLADMGAVERAVRGHFGAAFCLGNTLPHLLSPESLSRMFVGLKRRLLPGSPFLFQVLNYERIRAGEQRALPVEFVPTPRGELAILRFFETMADGIVLHTTSALRHQATTAPTIEIVHSHATQLRGWTREELDTISDVVRWPTRAVYGGMDETPYEPRTSDELVMVVG